MGKASSSKKVARAARAGGKATGQRRNLGFPAAIVAICVLGVGLVAFARSEGPGDGPPTLDDHWHAAVGIYVCDRWVANLSDRGADTLGIHTHEDGLIHIHPFLAGATGDAATLGKFFDQTGIKVTDTSITLPPGDVYGERKYKEGETKCGDEPGRVVLAHWRDAATASGSPDEFRTSGFGDQHLDEDGGAYTIAFVPKGASVPPPPSAPNIVELGAADGGSGQPVEGQPSDSERPDDPITDDTIDPESTEPGDTSSESTEAPAGASDDTGSTEAPAETTAPAGG